MGPRPTPGAGAASYAMDPFKGVLVKLHEFAGASSPQRVRFYLAEKGLDIPSEPVDLPAGEHRGAEFLAKNPMGRVPVLELEDGRCVSETLAIMEYLEELNPEPALIGETPWERAQTRSLDRVVELEILVRVMRVFQNTNPAFAARIRQSGEAAEAARANLAGPLKVLDQMAETGPFLAGQRVTIADGTRLAAARLAERAGVVLLDGHPSLGRWYEGFSARHGG